MNDRHDHHHEKYTHTPERIEIIGRPLPALADEYEYLSDVTNIRVRTQDEPFRTNRARADVSEKQLIDDLLDFCGRVKEVPVSNLDEKERELVESVDEFVESIHFLTHEDYREAVSGIAGRHAQWLAANPARILKIGVHSNKTKSSQSQIATDLRNAIVGLEADYALRVHVGAISHVDCTDNTKIVLADDWSVSGNYIAQDIANTYRATSEAPQPPNIEVNLLLAREDQVEEGIRAVDRLKDSYPGYRQPEVVAYFSTPAVKSVYGYQAVPSGSHSSVDYGFSETLSSMYRVLERHERGKGEMRLPYAATIVPKYSHDYE